MEGTGSGRPDNGVRAGWPAESAEAGKAANDARILQYALRLWGIINRISPEELGWQESHYDHDSRTGRELLFLIANNEWTRVTSEIVDINRSDALDTVIKIDVDLDQLTHEAFRKSDGRFWLPVLVLPPQEVTDERGSPSRRPDRDSLSIVTDAAGGLLARMPNADVNHRISAAMAEIIVNIAAARWSGSDDVRPTATRDQRLLLSAAIYRLLQRGDDPPSAGPSADTGEELHRRSYRVGTAKDELRKLFGAYLERIAQPAAATRPPRAGSMRRQPPGLGKEADDTTPWLTRRAIEVLEAFAKSEVIVVPVDRRATPTVLTVRAPSRELSGRGTWKLTDRWTWILQPLVHLEIDVLLPSAEADRRVQVNLPDGLFFEENTMLRSSLDIEVKAPRPLEHLDVLIGQLLDKRLVALRRCLADLAHAKSDILWETLRWHYIAFGIGETIDTNSDRRPAMEAVEAVSGTLRGVFDGLSTGRSVTEQMLTELRAGWDQFHRLTGRLFRRTSADKSSPRLIEARADMIADDSQRATTVDAKIHVYIGLADAEYFSIARFSGWMSMLLMAVVLISFLVIGILGYSVSFSPEVLAIVLTLFSALQAGRIERPDRSTLRGMLSTGGNWLIVASVLPTVILAVTLAFSPSWSLAATLAGSCMGLQLLLQLAMWRGPLSGRGSPTRGRPRKLQTRKPDYRYSDVLQSSWWRSTTADALLIGRKAYAYAVWQEGSSATLADLLKGARQSSLPSLYENQAMLPVLSARNSPANVLAMVRSGTADQAVTFMVFREEPAEGWAGSAYTCEVDLNPDRLAPLENVTGTVDVFVGLPCYHELLALAEHPLVDILGAAKEHGLIVLEAQLPVPGPIAVYPPCRWSRVRVAVRDTDIAGIAPFVESIHERAVATKRVKGQQRVVAVQTVPAYGPRIIPATAPPASVDELILASGLDVIPAAVQGESVDAPDWLVLAICADARTGIETDIVQTLTKKRPKLQLAGLTYALLHGTSVVLLLGREAGGQTAHQFDLQAELTSDQAPAALHVLVSGWRSRRQLGEVKGHPLLRLHFRAQDRPGALLDVLDSLGKALQDELPPSSSFDWSVWYAHTQVVDGADLASLTIRLGTDPRNVTSWSSNTFQDMERKIRTLAGRRAAAFHIAGSSFSDNLETPADPVISVNLMRAPAPADRGT